MIAHGKGVARQEQDLGQARKERDAGKWGLTLPRTQERHCPSSGGVTVPLVAVSLYV